MAEKAGIIMMECQVIMCCYGRSSTVGAVVVVDDFDVGGAFGEGTVSAGMPEQRRIGQMGRVGGET